MQVTHKLMSKLEAYMPVIYWEVSIEYAFGETLEALLAKAPHFEGFLLAIAEEAKTEDALTSVFRAISEKRMQNC